MVRIAKKKKEEEEEEVDDLWRETFRFLVILTLRNIRDK